MPKPWPACCRFTTLITVQRSFESLAGLCILHTIAISTADPPPRTAPEADRGHSLRSRFGSGEKNPPLSTCKSFHHLRPEPGQLVPPVSSRNAQVISPVSSTYLHISGLNRSLHWSAFRDFFCVLSLHWFQGILRSLPLKRGCIHWQQLLSAATSSQSLLWLWFFTVTERSSHFFPQSDKTLRSLCLWTRASALQFAWSRLRNLHLQPDIFLPLWLGLAVCF